MLNTLNEFHNRRQWHGLPCHAEEEEVPKMGTRRGRARESGFKGSREAHAGVEKGGKGMFIFNFTYIYIR